MCYNSDRTNQCDFFIWDEDQEDEKKRRLNKVLPSSHSPPKTPSSSKRARPDELENHRQSNSYNDDDNERQQERGSPSRKPVKLARFSTPDPVSNNNNTTNGSEFLLTPFTGHRTSRREQSTASRSQTLDWRTPTPAVPINLPSEKKLNLASVVVKLLREEGVELGEATELLIRRKIERKTDLYERQVKLQSYRETIEGFLGRIEELDVLELLD